MLFLCAPLSTAGMDGSSGRALPRRWTLQPASPSQLCQAPLGKLASCRAHTADSQSARAKSPRTESRNCKYKRCEEGVGGEVGREREPGLSLHPSRSLPGSGAPPARKGTQPRAHRHHSPKPGRARRSSGDRNPETSAASFPLSPPPPPGPRSFQEGGDWI